MMHDVKSCSSFRWNGPGMNSSWWSEHACWRRSRKYFRWSITDVIETPWFVGNLIACAASVMIPNSSVENDGGDFVSISRIHLNPFVVSLTRDTFVGASTDKVALLQNCYRSKTRSESNCNFMKLLHTLHFLLFIRPWQYYRLVFWLQLLRRCTSTNFSLNRICLFIASVCLVSMLLQTSFSFSCFLIYWLIDWLIFE